QFGGKNDVITGIALLHPGRIERIITHVRTTLTMRPMTGTELEAYLDSGAWRGKAGAYALQEGGDKFVLSAKGSESNVVGLPLEKLDEILSEIEYNTSQS
ncbi:MAG: Maf-like protein, partial [Planctomycetes bacterium]|nr:Maf-like protein [Planctomycetota bacterium]